MLVIGLKKRESNLKKIFSPLTLSKVLLHSAYLRAHLGLGLITIKIKADLEHRNTLDQQIN